MNSHDRGPGHRDVTAPFGAAGSGSAHGPLLPTHLRSPG